MTLNGVHPNLVEFLHEELTVFSVYNCLHRCSQHLHVIFLEDTILIELHTAV